MSSAKSFRSLIGLSQPTASTSDSNLLIIDAQNEYATGLLKTSNVTSTRRAISQLLSTYRSSSSSSPLNIIHILHSVPAGVPVFTPSTELAEEFSELQPQEGESVVKKTVPGAFTGTGLQELLENTGRKKVVLVGYMAHVCVSTTARQASERGYEVVVVREAVGDRDIPGAEAGKVVEGVLREIEDAFGGVCGVGDVK